MVTWLGLVGDEDGLDCGEERADVLGEENGEVSGDEQTDPVSEDPGDGGGEESEDMTEAGKRLGGQPKRREPCVCVWAVAWTCSFVSLHHTPA